MENKDAKVEALSAQVDAASKVEEARALGSAPLTITFEGGVMLKVRLYQATFDKDHSLQYIMEQCLDAGVEAKRRSKEYSEQAQNNKAFNAAIALDPAIVTRPEDMARLLKKYRIGASRSAA